jgi:hypothetical protein
MWSYKQLMALNLIWLKNMLTRLKTKKIWHNLQTLYSRNLKELKASELISVFIFV